MSAKRTRIAPYAIFRGSAFEGWTVKYIAKNLWRMHGQMDFNDMMQEAIVVFLRVHKQYKDRIQNRAHLMRLYQISLVNEFNDLARKTGRFNEVHVTLTDDSPALDEIATCEWSPEILTKLKCAPAEIKRLLKSVAAGADVRSPRLREMLRETIS